MFWRKRGQRFVTHDDDTQQANNIIKIVSNGVPLLVCVSAVCSISWKRKEGFKLAYCRHRAASISGWIIPYRSRAPLLVKSPSPTTTTTTGTTTTTTITKAATLSSSPHSLLCLHCLQTLFPPSAAARSIEEKSSLLPPSLLCLASSSLFRRLSLSHSLSLSLSSLSLSTATEQVQHLRIGGRRRRRKNQITWLRRPFYRWEREKAKPRAGLSVAKRTKSPLFFPARGRIFDKPCQSLHKYTHFLPLLRTASLLCSSFCRIKRICII